MRTIGLLGGMSWESTAVYYRRINELVQAKLGGVASASILLHSFNFKEIEELQHADQWEQLGTILTDAALGLRHAGADFLVIATNTMHLLADEIETGAGLPVLHIADATASEILQGGYTRVALLGTRFTMERGFYVKRIEQVSGANCLVPEEDKRAAVHRIIYEELCTGHVRDRSRTIVVDVINRLAARGAEAAILGCTELPLLVSEGDASIPVLDTTEVHVRAAVQCALDQSSAS